MIKSIISSFKIFAVVGVIISTISTMAYIRYINNLHEEQTKELSELKEKIKGQQEAFDNVTVAYQSLLNASFELEKTNYEMEQKIKSHDYVKIQEKKPQLAQKIYEKNINEYYNTFFNCRVCSNDRNSTPKKADNKSTLN